MVSTSRESNPSGVSKHNRPRDPLRSEWPGLAHASGHKNCEDGHIAGGNSTEGPRTAHLGNSTDTSGGIRNLDAVVYNGSSLTIPTDWGYYSEMWGPGATWACQSWRDSSGMTPGDPATIEDHHWNPNATKLIIPVSDEGPYGGFPEPNSRGLPEHQRGT